MKRSVIVMLMSAIMVVAMASEKQYIDGLFFNIVVDAETGNKYAEVASGNESEYPGGIPQGDIVIPEKVTVNGETYPVTGIEASALIPYCIFSERNISIPNTVTCIGENAFIDYINWSGMDITDKTITLDIPESIEVIGASGLACVNADEELYLPNISYIGGRCFYEITSKKVVLGPNLSVLGGAAFSSSEIEEIVFEPELSPRQDNKPILARRAFEDIKLKELKLPEWKYMSMGDCVGFNCRNLERVIFTDIKEIEYCYGNGPTSSPGVSLMTVIYGYFFMGCPNLKEIVCLGEVPPQVTNTERLKELEYGGYLQRDTDRLDFMDNMEGCVLKVPAGSEALYRADPVWGRFEKIEGFAPGEYSGIGKVPVLETDTEAAPVYYNLQGIQVKEPVKGQLYIRKAGEETTKVIM